MAEIPELPQDWLEHVSVCTSQYDSTCRSLACELLRSRARIRELEQALQRATELLKAWNDDEENVSAVSLLEMTEDIIPLLDAALHATDKAVNS